MRHNTNDKQLNEIVVFLEKNVWKRKNFINPILL